MRLYTLAARELFHRSATRRHKKFRHKKAQKAQMKDGLEASFNLVFFCFEPFVPFCGYYKFVVLKVSPWRRSPVS
jgi:hypothetical protein